MNTLKRERDKEQVMNANLPCLLTKRRLRLHSSGGAIAQSARVFDFRRCFHAPCHTAESYAGGWV